MGDWMAGFCERATTDRVGAHVLRRLLSLICLVLCLSLVAGPAAARSADDGRAPASKEAGEELKDPELARKVLALNGRLRSVEGWMTAVEQRLAAVEAELFRATGAWEKAKAELQRRRVQLVHAMWRLAGQRAVIRKNAAAIYMQGGPWTQANALLNAKDLSAIRDVGTFAQIVLHNYIDVLRKIEREKARIARLHAAARIRTAEAYARTLEIRRKRDGVLAEWRQASAARDAVIRQLAHLGAPILRLFRVSAGHVKALLVGAQKGQHAPGRRYQLPWPVGGHISSRFGWRIHPIFHYRSFHTGIDIAGNGGRTIKAPASGRVLAARAMGAYGLAVVLDHGRAVGSVFAHLSSTFVRAGDTVRKGDVIGRVGCTGWCTGPHLHFEIWVGAEPRNPLFWLS